MDEETTVTERAPADDGGTLSALEDYWLQFARWLAGLNGIAIMLGGFALGVLTGRTETFDAVSGLCFLVGGLFPILQLFLPSAEEEGGFDYNISLGERAAYAVTMLAWSITPTGILAQLLQIPGNFVPYLRYGRDLPSRERHLPETDLRLPFDGEWTTVNGGVTKESSHSWGLVSQRYAYDFVITDDDGDTHEGTGADLTDYYAFGEPIRAPAAGTVVATRDDLRDHPWPHRPWMEYRTHRITGNYVVIEHADGEYSLLAHLQEDSVTVETGDTVAAGDVIGRCGNSGNSSEPHLHYQLMDRRNFWIAAGLVPRFDGVTLSREDDAREGHDVYEPIGDGAGEYYLWGGDRVAPAETDRDQASPIPSR
jgi:murein DD-endopeptidase MepM/ murein hydrolase activator NlpD